MKIGVTKYSNLPIIRGIGWTIRKTDKIIKYKHGNKFWHNYLLWWMTEVFLIDKTIFFRFSVMLYAICKS